MNQQKNSINKFWQELKRRNVVRVITVYAGAAFVIIELINNITEPLRLPEWTPTLVIVLLAIGFPIAIIFSWIYDIHPEEGVVKTEAADKVKVEDSPKSSNSWKIASYISFVVIVGLIVLNIVPRSNRDKEFRNLEKSIAVLPFTNMTSEENFAHIGSAFCDEIIMELQKINSFDRVLSHTSTMQYAVNRPTIPEIGEKLNVNFLVEGSIQKHGDEVSIKVQVIRVKQEDHIWADEYNGKWVDIFTIQDEIAFKVAKELQVVLSPEEQEQIKKIPTTSLTAYDFYQRGREEHSHYWSDNNDRAALLRAEELYHKALEYDSTYALAFTGLAYVYWNKQYWESYFSENFLDSVLILADKALSFDPQLSEAYVVRGHYYRQRGFAEQAIREYDRAIILNPNDWMAYYGRGLIYYNIDLVKSLANYHEAASLTQGSELPIFLRTMGYTYYHAGFIEKGKKYIEDAFKLDGNSVRYYSYLADGEWYRDNYTKGIEILEKGYAIDSTDSGILLSLGLNYMFLNQFEESLKYFRKYIDRLEEQGTFTFNDMVEIGYVYFQNGYKEEADYYFDEQINFSNKQIELNRQWAAHLYPYYNLAAVYAFRGEKDKAYENLRIFNQRTMMLIWADQLIKNDPLFDNIRDESEFQQIVRDVEAKYQAEHERVRQWLEENEML